MPASLHEVEGIILRVFGEKPRKIKWLAALYLARNGPVTKGRRPAAKAEPEPGKVCRGGQEEIILSPDLLDIHVGIPPCLRARDEAEGRSLRRGRRRRRYYGGDDNGGKGRKLL